jgi:hypothetical protein
MDIGRLIVIAVLIGIIASMASAAFQLAGGKGDSGKMLKALTWRICLSVALFVVLIVAWKAGIIQPHGLK